MIELTDKERTQLTNIIKKGSSPAKVTVRSNILLASDSSEGKTLSVADPEERFSTTLTTVQRLEFCYEQSGLDTAFYKKAHNNTHTT